MATTTIGELLLHMEVDGDKKVIDMFQRIVKKTKEADKSLSQFGKTSKSSNNNIIELTASIGGLVKGFLGLKAIDLAWDSLMYFGRAIKEGIKEGILYNTEIERLTASMEALTGSEKIAAQITKDLAVLAADTPFAIMHYSKAAKTLLGYGVAVNDIIPVSKMLGDVSMGNATAFDRLSLAYGQVMAKGKLQAEEVRQMVNQGFNPLKFIAERTGFTMEELADKMRKGEISAAMVTQAFKDATSEGGRFNGSMDKLAKTWSGQTQKIQEYKEIFWANLVRPLQNFIGENILPIIAEHLITAGNAAESWGETLLQIALKIGRFLVPLKELAQVKFNEFINTFNRVKSVLISFFRVLATADVDSLSIMFRNLLPREFKSLAENFATGVWIIRNASTVLDEVKSIFQSFIKVLTTGDINDITIMLTNLLPPEFKDMGNVFAKIIWEIRRGLSQLPVIAEFFMNFVSKIYEGIQFIAPYIRDILIHWFKEAFRAISEIDWAWLGETFGRFGKSVMELINQLKPGLAILGAIFIVLYNTVKGVAVGIIKSMDNILGFVVDTVTLVIDFINALLAIFEGNTKKADEIVDRMIQTIISMFANLFQAVIDIVTGLVDGIIKGFQYLYNIVVGNSIIPDMVNAILRWFNTLLSSGKAIFNTIKSVLVSIVSSIANSIKSKFNLIKSIASTVFNAVASVVRSRWNQIKSIVSSVAGYIANIVRTKFNQIKSIASSILNSVYSIASSKWNQIKSIISSVSGYIANIVRSKFNQLKSNASNALASLISIARGKWNTMKSNMSSALSNMVSTAKSKMNSVKSAITGAIKNINLYQAGKNIVNSLANGVRSGVAKVAGAAQSISSAIKRNLGFSSPTEDGDGKHSDKWMPNLINMLTTGIIKGKLAVSRASGQLATAIKDNLVFTPSTIGVTPSAINTSGANTLSSEGNVVINIYTDNRTTGKELGKQFVTELNSKGILTHK